MPEFCSRARTPDKTCRAMKDGNCTLLQGCNEGDFSFEDLCMSKRYDEMRGRLYSRTFHLISAGITVILWIMILLMMRNK